MCAESGGLPGRGGDLLPDHLPHTEGRGAHRLVLQGVRLQARLPRHRYRIHSFWQLYIVVADPELDGTFLDPKTGKVYEFRSS